MNTALLKLSDIGARFLFVIGTLYLLTVHEAGQFGLLNTLIAYYVFLVGFERYSDVQRQVAAADDAAVRHIISATIGFYFINHLLFLPVLAIVAVSWLKFSPQQMGFVLVIAIGEQLAVESYRLALVAPQYRVLLSIAVVRSVSLVLFSLALVISPPHHLTLSQVLALWASVSAAALLAMALRLGYSTSRPIGIQAKRRSIELLFKYRASLTHFFTGLLALCSGQLDRLVVGLVGGVDLAGVYFKNLLIAASVYQATTVLMQNRIVPEVYRALMRRTADEAAAILDTERLRLIGWFAVALCATSLLLTVAHRYGLSKMESVRVPYVATLLAAFLIRSIGDFNCVFLNAARQERRILLSHGIAVVGGTALCVPLTHSLGIAGTVVSVAFSAVLLASVSGKFRRTAHLRLRAAI